MKRLRNNAVKIAVACMICLLLGFLLGKFKQDLLLEKIAVINIDNQALQVRNASLDSELSRLQVNAVSEQQSIKSLLESNKQLENALASANNKLVFYERVVAPELAEKGIQVYSFEITKNQLTKQWDYQLVLMQSQKERRLLKGKFNITLSVFEGDKLQQVKLSTLVKDIGNSFKFKYFQTIQGSYSLPETFTVDEVIINLSVPGNRWYKAQKREARYDWRVLTAEDSGNLSEFDSRESSRDE